MAVAKSRRLEYANMTAEQKKRAEAWGEKWGRPATECPMIGTGLIITNREKLLKHMTAEDYNIVTKHYVKKVSEITDEIREKYRADMEQLKADNLPKVRLRG